MGEVIGHKYPALLFERDCVIHLARFLVEEASRGTPPSRGADVTKDL
jgi:hypothetical protein